MVNPGKRSTRKIHQNFTPNFTTPLAEKNGEHSSCLGPRSSQFRGDPFGWGRRRVVARLGAQQAEQYWRVIAAREDPQGRRGGRREEGEQPVEIEISSEARSSTWNTADISTDEKVRYFRKPLRGPPTHGTPKPPSNKKKIPKTPKTSIIPKSRRSFPKSRRSFRKSKR